MKPRCVGFVSLAALRSFTRESDIVYEAVRTPAINKMPEPKWPGHFSSNYFIPGEYCQCCLLPVRGFQQAMFLPVLV